MCYVDCHHVSVDCHHVPVDCQNVSVDCHHVSLFSIFTSVITTDSLLWKKQYFECGTWVVQWRRSRKTATTLRILSLALFRLTAQLHTCPHTHTRTHACTRSLSLSLSLSLSRETKYINAFNFCGKWNTLNFVTFCWSQKRQLHTYITSISEDKYLCSFIF